ncbi:MAG: hypothetical protein Q4E99_03935 [Bacillota bacterium]|nr:hypothetical protein [Bacillota bacterium]
MAKQKQLEFFTTEELKQPELTEHDKHEIIENLLRRAKLGVQFLYDVHETANMLRLTIDEMQGLIYSYRLDCTSIRTTLRIPWWSICEYLIDPAEDVDKAVQDYLKTLPQKHIKASA